MNVENTGKKRVMNKDRKRRYRRKQRKKKELRFRETWKEIPNKSEEIGRDSKRGASESLCDGQHRS